MSYKADITGERIRTLRKAAGLSQQELADELHYSRTTIIKWETQKEGLIDADNLMLIAEFFNVSVDYLLGRIDETNHDYKYIHDFLGIEEKSAYELHHLHQYGSTEEKKTIDLINRVLSDTSISPGRWALDTTLFYWLEKYITSDSIKSKNTAIDSGIVEYIDTAALYREALITRIRNTLEDYRKQQKKQPG